jgi:hypothetical protein
VRRIHLASYFFALGLLLCAARHARAQTDAPRWEAGGQFSVFNVTNGKATAPAGVVCLNLPCVIFDSDPNERRTEMGFGGRVGYSFNRHLSAEAEVNFFPRERALNLKDFTGGRKFQGLFGVKVGRRFGRFGLFAKARPGFVNFKEGDLRDRGVCVTIFPSPLGCFQTGGRTDFAFDVGGGVELHTSAHTFVRLDAGDTVLRARAHNLPARARFSPTGPTFQTAFVSPAATTHNFQGSAGFGFRF